MCAFPSCHRAVISEVATDIDGTGHIEPPCLSKKCTPLNRDANYLADPESRTPAMSVTVQVQVVSTACTMLSHRDKFNASHLVITDVNFVPVSSWITNPQSTKKSQTHRRHVIHGRLIRDARHSILLLPQ